MKNESTVIFVFAQFVFCALAAKYEFNLWTIVVWLSIFLIYSFGVMIQTRTALKNIRKIKDRNYNQDAFSSMNE
jgi:hypothetical protein